MFWIEGLGFMVDFNRVFLRYLVVRMSGDKILLISTCNCAWIWWFYLFLFMECSLILRLWHDAFRSLSLKNFVLLMLHEYDPNTWIKLHIMFFFVFEWLLLSSPIGIYPLLLLYMANSSLLIAEFQGNNCSVWVGW